MNTLNLLAGSRFRVSMLLCLEFSRNGCYHEDVMFSSFGRKCSVTRGWHLLTVTTVFQQLRLGSGSSVVSSCDSLFILRVLPLTASSHPSCYHPSLSPQHHQHLSTRLAQHLWSFNWQLWYVESTFSSAFLSYHVSNL